MLRTTFTSVTFLLAVVMGLSACSKSMDSDTYSSSTSVGKVSYGTIILARPITIDDSDRLQDDALGGIAGGAAGGIGASTIGKGKGKGLATVGGVVAGALIGALVEDELSKQSGYEYLIKLDGGKAAPANTTEKHNYSIQSGRAVTKEVNDSVELISTTSETISVIQADEIPLSPGQRVVIIYRDDRARVTAMPH